MFTEADTCRKYVLPELLEAGWDMEPDSLAEQRPITDGRVVLVGEKAQRRQPKRPDYLLRYTSDFTIAVVEAKSIDRQPRRKYYFDGGQVEIATEIVYELDPNTGKQLRVVQYTGYAAEQVRTLSANAPAFLEAWANPEHRESIKGLLAERGVDFEHLQQTAHLPDADPLDLLCHLAFNAPLRTRRERAERLKKEQRIIEIMKNIQKLLAEGAQ